MKKVTKKQRKAQGRNAFVQRILSSGESFTLGSTLYVKGRIQMNSRGVPVQMPTVRATYGVL